MESYFTCCNMTPIFLITYSVADKKITYHVCNDCSKLQCFSDYILTNVPLSNKQEK